MKMSTYKSHQFHQQIRMSVSLERPAR